MPKVIVFDVDDTLAPSINDPSESRQLFFPEKTIDAFKTALDNGDHIILASSASEADNIKKMLLDSGVPQASVNQIDIIGKTENTALKRLAAEENQAMDSFSIKVAYAKKSAERLGNNYAGCVIVEDALMERPDPSIVHIVVPIKPARGDKLEEGANRRPTSSAYLQLAMLPFDYLKNTIQPVTLAHNVKAEQILTIEKRGLPHDFALYLDDTYRQHTDHLNGNLAKAVNGYVEAMVEQLPANRFSTNTNWKSAWEKLEREYANQQTHPNPQSLPRLFNNAKPTSKKDAFEDFFLSVKSLQKLLQESPKGVLADPDALKQGLDKIGICVGELGRESLANANKSRVLDVATRFQIALAEFLDDHVTNSPRI